MKFFFAICLALSLALAGAQPAVGQEQNQRPEAGAEETWIQYQALGQQFVAPMVREAGLFPLPAQNSPAWQMLSAAWNQARLIPCQIMGSWDMGEVNIYLAIMGSQANGRQVAAPVERGADFISSQLWLEYDENFDLNTLTHQRPIGLGVFARDDNSIYAISVQRAAGEGLPDGQQLSSMMVSSISLLNGIPVVVGVAGPQHVNAKTLFNICHNLTLYLALVNHLPDNGFFNPDLKNLVIAGRRLRLALPEDACLLRASTPRQAVALIQWERFFSDTHSLIAAYAPCDKLEAWLEGPAKSRLTWYGLLAANLYEGQLQRVDGSFARNLRQEQQGEPLQAEQLNQLDWQQLGGQMPMGAMEVPGHLGMRANVAFWPALVKASDPGAQISGLLAGVLAVGAVNGLAITNAMFMPIEEKEVFTELLKQQQTIFSKFK